MPRYMIQASHDPSHDTCTRVLNAFLKAGAHYLTNADWGCLAGEHTAWITVEADDDYQARLMVPPVIRRTAQVTKLNRLTTQEIQELFDPVAQLAK